MKISMGGRYRPDELVEAFDRVVQNFQANGADEFRSVTFYLNAFHEKRHLVLRDEKTGNSLQTLHYDGPHERTYRPISPRIQVVDGGDDGKASS